MEETEYLEHKDDKFLWWAKWIANILLFIAIAFFAIFGAICCVKISMWYLLYVFLGPLFSYISWIFVRVLLSLCHDVKIIRNDVVSHNSKKDDATAAATDKAPPAEDDKKADGKETAFCPSCGAQTIGDEKFCRMCGERLL